MPSRFARAAFAALVPWLVPFAHAFALEEQKDEKDKLKSCEVTLCALVTKKAPADGDMVCQLSRTWARDRIKEGSATGKISWGFGDARCTVELRLPRAAVISAMTQPKSTLQFPEHTVACEIERDKEVTPVTLKLAPKVKFEGGQAVSAKVNLKAVDAPSGMKALAFTVARLEDSVGLFHKRLIGALNYQLHDKCTKTGG